MEGQTPAPQTSLQSRLAPGATGYPWPIRTYAKPQAPRSTYPCSRPARKRARAPDPALRLLFHMQHSTASALHATAAQGW